KLKLLNVEKRRVRNQLRILVESVYGVDNLGLSIEKEYIDIETDKPKWLGEVKRLLENKYDKEVDIEELENLSNNDKHVKE
ncbi:MAG: hypothetical protein ACOCP8_04320, partial [archaeon]